MIYRRTYGVALWSSWDHEINAAAMDFQRRFGSWPNILLASQATMGWFDLLASRSNVRHEDDGRMPADTEHAVLSTFLGEDYALELCLRHALPVGAFILIYDDDPEGEEEVPEEDTPEEDTLTPLLSKEQVA